MWFVYQIGYWLYWMKIAELELEQGVRTEEEHQTLIKYYVEQLKVIHYWKEGNKPVTFPFAETVRMATRDEITVFANFGAKVQAAAVFYETVNQLSDNPADPYKNKAEMEKVTQGIWNEASDVAYRGYYQQAIHKEAAEISEEEKVKVQAKLDAAEQENAEWKELAETWENRFYQLEVTLGEVKNELEEANSEIKKLNKQLKDAKTGGRKAGKNAASNKKAAAPKKAARKKAQLEDEEAEEEEEEAAGGTMQQHPQEQEKKKKKKKPQEAKAAPKKKAPKKAAAPKPPPKVVAKRQRTDDSPDFAAKAAPAYEKRERKQRKVYEPTAETDAEKAAAEKVEAASKKGR
jgi:hypothetical protein